MVKEVQEETSCQGSGGVTLTSESPFAKVGTDEEVQQNAAGG